MKDVLDEVNELIQDEDLEGALQLIDEALPTCYNPTELLSQKAWILNRLDEYEQAYLILEKLHNEGLDNLWFWSEYGYTLRHLGYYDRALDALYYAYDHGRDDAFVATELAQVYVEMEYFEEAKEFYLHALELSGDDIWIYLMLSDVLCQLKEYDEAYKYLKRVYDLEVFSPDVYAQLGWVCNRLGRHEEACTYLSKLEGEDFNDWAKVEISFSYNRLEKSEEALKLLQSVKETSLQGFGYELALAKLNTGDYEGAKAFYLSQPRNDYIVDMLVTIALDQKHYREAIDYLNEFIEANPHHIEAYEAIAYIQRHYENDYVKSLESTKSLLEKGVRNEFVYITIVELLLILDKEEEALGYIQEGKPYIENKYAYYYLSSEIYSELGDFEKAYEYLVKAKPYKCTTSLLSQEAQFLRILERYDEALARLEEIKDDVNEVWFCNEKGSIYEALKQHEEAVSWFLKSLQMQPDNFFANLHLGGLYYEMKEYDKALECLLVTHKQRQDILWVVVDIACIYEAKKKYELSLNFYQQALQMKPDDSWLKERYKKTKMKLKRKRTGE